MRHRTAIATLAAALLALQLCSASLLPASAAGNPRASDAGKHVTITGRVTWSDKFPYNQSGQSGGENQTGTFNINVVSKGSRPGGKWTSRTKYRVHETLDETQKIGECTTTYKGSTRKSGTLPDPGTGKARIEVSWDPPYLPGGYYAFYIVIEVKGTVKQTITGPKFCDPGTTTDPVTVSYDPACYDQPGLLLPGKFKGKNYNGTVAIKCSGTFKGPPTIVYKASGKLIATTKRR
jgi:hypothetical protein